MNNYLLIMKYILFATVATTVNLIVQRVTLNTISIEFNLMIAILLGTLAGLIVKYSLDKRWIFYYHTKAIIKNTSTFGKYSFFGLITTLIFWIFETTFWLLYKDDFMREFGAVIGLTIGYYIKFKIDKRYVFV